jgi:hypothetical protein
MTEKFDHTVMISHSSASTGFRCDGDRTTEVRLLIQDHREKISRWLKTGTVTLSLNDDDLEVLATLIPDRLTDEPFKTFKLPFAPVTP